MEKMKSLPAHKMLPVRKIEHLIIYPLLKMTLYCQHFWIRMKYFQPTLPAVCPPYCKNSPARPQFVSIICSAQEVWLSFEQLATCHCQNQPGSITPHTDYRLIWGKNKRWTTRKNSICLGICDDLHTNKQLRNIHKTPMEHFRNHIETFLNHSWSTLKTLLYQSWNTH